MICPQCLATIDDDAQVCPHCHAYVGAEAPHAHFVFCEGCGARLSPQDRTCPKCGRPAPGILSTSASASDLAAGKTASFPRLTQAAIETELPRIEARSAQSVLTDSLDASATSVLSRDELDSRAAGGDADPYHSRKRPIKGILIAVLAVALIGGGAAFVALDPLGVMPGVYEWVRASAEDMFPSREGMGGAAQQGAPDEQGGTDGTTPAAQDQPLTDEALSDAAAFQQIHSAYERVVSINDGERFADAINSFNNYYLATDRATREDASKGAFALRDELQGIIDELDGMVLADGSPYTEDRDHVRQLAQWMYERVDMICESWDVSLGYPEGEGLLAHQDEILAPMREAGDTALNSYYENVTQWEPVEK